MKFYFAFGSKFKLLKHTPEQKVLVRMTRQKKGDETEAVSTLNKTFDTIRFPFDNDLDLFDIIVI